MSPPEKYRPTSASDYVGMDRGAHSAVNQVQVVGRPFKKQKPT